MINKKKLFLNNLAQTSDNPMLLEIEKASGVYMYRPDGSKVIDLISGVSVSVLGHNHPDVVKAVKNQVDKYMHLMVYGELIQTPQVELAHILNSILPENLNSVYLVNSGSEATEGAVKLAKRYTGRTKIIAFKNAYHGSTNGALSLLGNDYFKRNYFPLLPGVSFIEFNNAEDLLKINSETAAVIVEPIQGEAGIVMPENDFLKLLQSRCKETGALLIFDEVQTGFGRTGKMFAFEHYGVVPDILNLAKAFGAGMPLGAFISSKKIMSVLSNNPVLGHITTFGGHPVSCAAAVAMIKTLLNEKELIDSTDYKNKLFKKLLKHSRIKSVEGIGLYIAVDLGDSKIKEKLIYDCMNDGVLLDPFLFAPEKFRISPPLIINEEQIAEACKIILRNLH